MTADETMGTLLRRHRLAAGLSLRELARRLHVGASTLSDYEQDRRVPAEALLTAYEEALGRPGGELTERRRSVLAERAPDTEPPPSEPRPSHRRWIAHPVLAGLLGAVLALAAQDLVPMLWRHGPVGAAAANKQTPAPHAPARDDSDPRDTGCDAGAQTLSAVDIDVPASYHIVVGQAVLRYSAACGTAWAEFLDTPVLDRVAPKSVITLTALRPLDHRRLPFTAPYVGTFMWGNMLLTAAGCVTVTVTVTAPALHAPLTASTPCLQHP